MDSATEEKFSKVSKVKVQGLMKAVQRYEGFCLWNMQFEDISRRFKKIHFLGRTNHADNKDELIS